MFTRRIGAVALFAVAFACAPGIADAQTLPDTLRGHARANDKGAYSIAFTDTDGPYTVVATLLGFGRQSVDVPRRGPSGRADVDFRLEAVAQRVAPVTIRAQRPRPQRRDGAGVGPGE